MVREWGRKLAMKTTTSEEKSTFQSNLWALLLLVNGSGSDQSLVWHQVFIPPNGLNLHHRRSTTRPSLDNTRKSPFVWFDWETSSIVLFCMNKSTMEKKIMEVSCGPTSLETLVQNYHKKIHGLLDWKKTFIDWTNLNILGHELFNLQAWINTTADFQFERKCE